MTKSRKKALIVTYYWYPSGGIGTYRISRFVKYLVKAGWEIQVLTTKKSVSGVSENKLEPEFEGLKVHQARIIEPVGLLRGKKNKASSTNDASIFFKQKKSILEKLIVWIRLNLLIPDAKLTWKWFAVPIGKKIIQSFDPDIIISSSPPPTTQLVARKLAKWSKKPWVADFRDPWTNIYYYDESPQSAISKRYNKKLERSVLNDADALTVVNHGFFNANDDENCIKITNGFDPTAKPTKSVKYDKFTLSYFGSLKKNQVPDNLLTALVQLEEHQPDLAKKSQVLFYGNVDSDFKESLKNSLHIIEINYHSFVPHQEMINLMYGANMLLFSVGKSPNSRIVLPTKGLEYLPTKTPILGIGQKDATAEHFIKHTKSGKFFDHFDSNGVYEYLYSVIQSWHQKKKYKSGHINIDDYNFEVLTKKLEEVMLNVMNQK